LRACPRRRLSHTSPTNTSAAGSAPDGSGTGNGPSSQVATSRLGIYAAGCASGPKTVAESIADARAIAATLGERRASAPEQSRDEGPSEGITRDRIEGVLRALMEMGQR
jgi:hypothetical protein